MSSSDAFSFAFFCDFKPQRQGLIAKARNVGRDLYRVVQYERLVKIEMNLDPGEPDVQAVEDLGVGQADRAKQFGFGNLKKSEELAVIDDTGAVDVRPPDLFFDG